MSFLRSCFGLFKSVPDEKTPLDPKKRYQQLLNDLNWAIRYRQAYMAITSTLAVLGSLGGSAYGIYELCLYLPTHGGFGDVEREIAQRKDPVNWNSTDYGYNCSVPVAEASESINGHNSVDICFEALLPQARRDLDDRIKDYNADCVWYCDYLRSLQKEDNGYARRQYFGVTVLALAAIGLIGGSSGKLLKKIEDYPSGHH